MKKILVSMFVTIAAMVTFSSCSKDENDAQKRESNLVGIKYYYNEDHNGYEKHSFGDYEFQKVYEALNFMPKDMYETSWNHKDTLLNTSYVETTRLELSFDSRTTAKLTDSRTINATQQKAEKYHHHYYFPKDYNAESSFYMINVTANTFNFYDKRKNIRTEFRLDANRCYDLVFYMKNGGTTKNTYTKNTDSKFTYDFNATNKTVIFKDEAGKSIEGYIPANDNNDGEKTFSMFYDGMNRVFTTKK